MNIQAFSTVRELEWEMIFLASYNYYWIFDSVKTYNAVR